MRLLLKLWRMLRGDCPQCGAVLEYVDMSMNWDLPGAYGFCKAHGLVRTV